MYAMKNEASPDRNESHRRIEEAYRKQKPGLLARLKAAGRTLEEAEDFVHDLYAETLERFNLVAEIRSLPAWINSLFTRRMIDLWRHEQVRKVCGEADIAEETLREIISGTGLDPLDEFVRESLVDALNDALRVLPAAQRRVIEAQVFGGQTFREIAETTGVSIDTLTARKRYAIRNLTGALRHWIDQ